MENKYRDVVMVPLNEDEVLIMACDSCGAVGMKEQDQVKAPPYIVGKYTARVSLMEVISLGAKVVCITVNICNELDPTGQAVLEGIRSELEECSIQVPITFSTEKNMMTNMTAVGVTVVGVGNRKDLLLNQSASGDFVYVIGIPKVGSEVVEDQGKIAHTAVLLQLLKVDGIKEIIPIGSSGIEGELDKFLQANQLNVEYARNLPVDMKKSAGPCTAMLVICKGELLTEGNIPQNLIGRLY